MIQLVSFGYFTQFCKCFIFLGFFSLFFFNLFSLRLERPHDQAYEFSIPTRVDCTLFCHFLFFPLRVILEFGYVIFFPMKKGSFSFSYHYTTISFKIQFIYCYCLIYHIIEWTLIIFPSYKHACNAWESFFNIIKKISPPQ
jgi:hypothetical protein